MPGLVCPSRRGHTRCGRDWSSDVCSSDLPQDGVAGAPPVFSSPKKQPPPDAKKIEELSKIRVQSPLVTAPVTVLNSAGEFVYDLEQNELEVLDNGVPQRLERFEVEGRALAAVVVVQTDDTVTPLLPHVRSLAPVFSSLVLGPQGKAAVVSYDRSEERRVGEECRSRGSPYP